MMMIMMGKKLCWVIKKVLRPNILRQGQSSLRHGLILD
jgi:hypothetical protein